MTAQEKLHKKNSERKHICVGLDTDISKIPAQFKIMERPAYEFNKAIIDATADLAAAYKINFAFYERDGVAGMRTIADTVSYIQQADPSTLVIADAKRGDIGNTSRYYAAALFDQFGADASTLAPYMGSDSLGPFLEYTDKLHFILALTSNPGAMDFEKLELKEGGFLYEKVIAKVAELNEYGNCGLVFGATQLEELTSHIAQFGDMPVLLPGVGAQGGDLTAVSKAFIERNKYNFIVNSSRGILYKDSGEEFAEAAREELERLNQVVASNY